jgi:SSS family solute:Na+ symporter
MNLSFFEWCIVGGMLLFMAVMAYRARKLTQGVADFLAANRCAGRYILSVSENMAGVGAITVLAIFEVGYTVGFAADWWGMIGMPLGLILTMSGWIIYRFRQTRALTMAQFFEIRYSKRFRIFAGSVCFITGLINFGIFPAVGANFFINYCGIPSAFPFLGLTVDTYPVLVFALVAIALFFTLIGGQVSVLLTDFFQGMFFNLTLLGILVVILVKFRLVDIFDALLTAPEDQSMVNPFKISKIPDFNIWFYIVTFITMGYNRLSWQGAQGYNSSARNAHEAKMAGVMGFIRSWAFGLSMVLLPLCAYTIMHHPNYTEQAQQVEQVLTQIENDEVRRQMITPMAMTTFLPHGVLGAFAAIMFAAFITTNDTYLHSWGSIFIQDVVVPLRKKPFGPKQHLKVLRLSIVGVGVFIACFSLFFKQTMPLKLFFMITGAIWMGGAGAVIIGGLYWKRGTTAGAYAALILGMALPVISLILDQIWIHYFDKNFWFGAKSATVASMFVAIAAYILVSVFGKRSVFNMDRMLHRGQYALPGESPRAGQATRKWSFKHLFGYSDEFTGFDKFIYGLFFGKSIILFTLFVVITIIALIFNFSDQTWANYHRYMIWINLPLAFICAIWITVGSFFDLRYMIKKLRAAKRNTLDDGTVVDHHNLDEEPMEEHNTGDEKKNPEHENRC